LAKRLASQMFSQKEIEYLRFPEKFGSDYSYVLKHKIKSKVQILNKELALLSNAGFLNLTDFSKITEFRKISQKTEVLENSSDSQNNDEILVGRTGLEPATFCTSSRCPTELDYRPIGIVYLHFQYIATSFFPL
jgi:hypothetical protein